MRNFLTVGEKFCPAKGENVPVQVWWDDEGARQEQCFHHGSCDHQSAFGDEKLVFDLGGNYTVKLPTPLPDGTVNIRLTTSDSVLYAWEGSL